MRSFPKLLLLFISVTLLTWSTPSQAFVWFQTGASISQFQSQQGSDILSTTRTIAATTLGFTLFEGVLLGAQYLYAGNQSDQEIAWSLGPKAGFFLDSFEITVAYLPFSKESFGATRRSGSGFAINVGYTWKLVGPLRLGIYGIYWVTSLSKENGNQLNPKIQNRYLAPQIALALDL